MQQSKSPSCNYTRDDIVVFVLQSVYFPKITVQFSPDVCVHVTLSRSHADVQNEQIFTKINEAAEVIYIVIY